MEPTKIDKIREQVEEKLQKQQANKEFKDVGRVAQTKKERSAYKLISGAILNDLEQDAVMAYNMVKKDGVWPEIDVKAQRDSGVTSGAAYLKVKIREAVPTRPADDKSKRATYVLFLENLQKDLSECFNVEQIKVVRDKIRNMSMDKVIGYFLNPDYNNATPEQKTQIETELKKNKHIQVAFMYSTSSLIPKLTKEVFSARFENMLFNRSDAAAQIWHDAKEKEPITEEESKALIENIKLRRDKFNAANQALIEENKDKTALQLAADLDQKWNITGESKKFYKQDIEKFREFAVSYYERRIKHEAVRFIDLLKKAEPRGNDWTWFDDPKQKEGNDKPKATPINTKPPLSYIKRIGGYKIDALTPSEIVEKFGFSAVNYGVYVDDKWSKEHTKHFLGAMADMAEVLNINIKQFNQLGKLSIAFGAKGRPGSNATYFPQTKDINLTKGNGDGSLAHEWGHYFDNVIVELDKKQATSLFATDGYMPDFELKMMFKELMDFIIKGSPDYTPKLPIQFYAQKSTSGAPTYYSQGKSNTIEIKETIEETLLPFQNLAVVDGAIYSTQKRIYGYIIDAFGLESYEIPMRLKTSYYYHKSAYNFLKYCYKSTKFDGKEFKEEIIIGADQRTKYWTSAVELFARAWESVILKKLNDAGRDSDYLVASIPTEDIISEAYNSPYPTGAELAHIETLIDKILLTVKAKFNIGNFIAPTTVREDEYLELTKTGKVDVGLEIEKTGSIKTVEFVGDTAEAIETLQLLIDLGGTETELKEWSETINKLKNN